MDIDLESILSVSESMEEESGPIDVPERSASIGEEAREEDNLPFNFNIAMALIENESGVMEAEVTEAVNEIEGQNRFPCDRCDKVCKSKAGLTRHINSKHRDNANEESNVPSLTKVELVNIVNNVKLKITEEGFWDNEILSNLANVSSNDTLFDALLPLYERFCRKRNQDNLLLDFYELIPKSTELLLCDNQQVCSLVMIYIPDHLVAFYKTGVWQARQGASSTDQGEITELDEKERGPLSYIAGYVLSKLQKKCWGKGKTNEELQVMLQNMKSAGTDNPYIAARSRGGLLTPCNDLVNILEIVEILFRNFIASSKTIVKTIPCDSLCNTALDLPLIKSLWENIMMGCSEEVSKQSNKLCLENIIKLYLKVRSFSYAKDYISKFNIQRKAAKSKALRRELKKLSNVADK